MSERKAEVSRETGETSVEVDLSVEGDGTADVDTGVGFFDHMLESFAKHGLFDLDITAEGDLETGDHHTVEDVGITIGIAFDEALGDRSGIRRFGDAYAPLDEALGHAVVDVSGRPYVVDDIELDGPKTGDMSTDMVPHFFRSVAVNSGLTLHLEGRGENDHHVVEALFKAFALALDDATRVDGRREGVPSTKGEL